MAVTTFQHGRYTKVYLDGWDISRIVKTSNTPTNREEHDTTTYGDTPEKTFQGGNWDGTVELGGYWVTDPDDLADLLDAASIFLIAPAGVGAVGVPARIALVFPTKDESPNDTADLTMQTATYRAQEGIRRGRFLKIPGAVGVGTVNGPSIDNGAATTGDWAFAGQCTALDAGTLTVGFQHSADDLVFVLLQNIAFDAPNQAKYVSGTASVASPIERYRRVAYTLAGGTTANFVAAVSTQ